MEAQAAGVGRLLSGEELHGLGLGVRATVLERGAASLRVPLLPPLFVEGVPGWELSWSGDRYPFLIAGRQLVPAAEPVFSTDQRARLLVPGPRLGEGPALAGRVVPEGDGDAGPGGRPVLELAVDDLPAVRGPPTHPFCGGWHC